MRAYRISDRAAKSGFEWTDMTAEFQNPDELPQRLTAAMGQPDEDLKSQEFGRAGKYLPSGQDTSGNRFGRSHKKF